MTLLFLATLAAAVVAFVLYPVFVSEPAGFDGSPLDARELQLSDLMEKKGRLLEAIKDLEFEHEAGKVSDADFDHARKDYFSQVAGVLEQVEALAPAEPRKQKKKGKTREPETTAESARKCSQCGHDNPDKARFCMQCGQAFAPSCGKCGETLPETARFCMACGAQVTS